MRKRTLLVAAAFAAGSAVLTAGAGLFIDVDISGAESVDGLGDPDNRIFNIFLTRSAVLIGADWNFDYFARSPSWSSQANIQLSNSSQTSVHNWDMGDWGGVDNSDPVALVGAEAFDVPLVLDDDGILRLEFYEDFVNDDDVVEGVYQDSILRIFYTPAPSCLALFGLAGLVGTRRRRS